MRILSRVSPFPSRRTGWCSRASGITLVPILAAALVLALCITPPAARATSVPEMLVDIIASRNLALRQQSLEDESYRGEEGILRIRPETARELGLKVSMGKDYARAKALHKEAEKELKRARQAMATERDETQPGQYVRTIAAAALLYKEKTMKANALLHDYARSLDPEIDERLDGERCSDLMARLLEIDLDKTGYRLRDALGCFVNVCQGTRTSSCLTPDNVRFVNAVFQEFVDQAPQEVLSRYDLDRLEPGQASSPPSGWTKTVGAAAANVATLIESSLCRFNPDETGSMDPLLFLALIRRESRFDPQAISHVGAAGLTQIMPMTGKDMGMENIYHPDYFEQAFSLLREEREARREAMDALFSITPENKLQMATKARERMQKSLQLKKEKGKLFARYRDELRLRPSDPRLQPEKAVEYGLRYFNRLLREQNGDISLALASYNAGPHRVRQYNGIPPYAETVRFRNRVLEFYREYRERLKES